MANLSAPAAADLDILLQLVAVEQQAQAAYEFGAKSGLLSAGVVAVATKISGQHAEHEKAWSAEVTKLGGTPPKAGPLQSPPAPKNEAEVLAYALGLETGAANAYFDLISQFSTPALRQLAASIMTDEAQHALVLSSAIKQPVINVTSFMPIKFV